MTNELMLREARPDDADAAVPLIHSSGPQAFDYVFDVPGRASSLDFLQRSFRDGRSEFGHRNHVVIEEDGRVVAAGAAWSGVSNLGFMVAAARQIVACYGVAAAGVIARGLRAESIIQPPKADSWYIAHLGVDPALRSRGLGEKLVRHLLESAPRDRCRHAALDVATTNPRAQALYERLGFRVTHERTSTLANERGLVPSHRRMVLTL